jgi:ABC-type thiamine transport system substrate-binding protein
LRAPAPRRRPVGTYSDAHDRDGAVLRTTLRPRTRFGTLTALTAVTALVLTACGGEKSTDAGPSAGPTGALPLKGEEIEVAAVWTGPEQENFSKVLKEFEKRTGATVTFVPAQDPIVNFLGTKIAGGSPPDVAMLPQVGAIRQAAAQKWIKPVGPEARRALEANYSRGWQELGEVDGTPYGVYFKAANKSLIWYNTAAFDNAGAAEPKTWKEFLSTAETISASGVTPVSVGGADGWTLTDWFENVYLSQAGPEKYDQLAKHEIKWTDPSVTAALKTLAELFGRPELLAGGDERGAPDRVPGVGDADVHGRRPAEGGDGLRGGLRRRQHRADRGEDRYGREGLPVPGGRLGRGARGDGGRRGRGPEGHQGGTGPAGVPGLAGRGADLGGRGRIPLAQQEPGPGRVPERRPAGDREGADRGR